MLSRCEVMFLFNFPFYHCMIYIYELLAMNSKNVKNFCGSKFFVISMKTFPWTVFREWTVQGPLWYSGYLISLFLKKKVTVAATEAGPPINEKSSSFRNTKSGIPIVFFFFFFFFLIKMCKMPPSKTSKGPLILNLRNCFTNCFQNLAQCFLGIQEYFNDIVLKQK